ncbi:MAG: hypothetical protein GYA55_03160 [SAR324 cluster bacterium]|uniref:VCBS repeat-containing protein n=1 Tax=SAR324 cluster bacterium TaxID=2024889 RepID=A0A7X9IKN5_9DELT|nr:hypothetical protein [SAR324 cluster bacterium]
MFLLLGAGNGTFTKKAEAVMPADLKEEFRSGDFNRDGLVDITGSK